MEPFIGGQVDLRYVELQLEHTRVRGFTSQFLALVQRPVFIKMEHCFVLSQTLGITRLQQL